MLEVKEGEQDKEDYGFLANPNLHNSLLCSHLCINSYSVTMGSAAAVADITYQPIRTRPSKPKSELGHGLDSDSKTNEEDHVSYEPLTPAGRVFSSSSFNLNICVILGFKSPCSVQVLKDGMSGSLLKHKRFSSVLKEGDKGELYWVPTTVNIDDHVKVVSPKDNNASSSTFVEEYAAQLMHASLDMSKPLFEIHVVKAKLGDAVENIVLIVHHSMGDGTSLMSLLLACTRRVDEPQSMPTLPTLNKKENTSKEGDNQTSIKGDAGVENLPRKLVHVTISLDDVRSIKQAIHGTVNDVMYGVLAAAVTRYLREQYGNIINLGELGKHVYKRFSLANLRVRACLLVNTRSSPGLHEIEKMMWGASNVRWGNAIGCMLLPITLSGFEDPLQCVRGAKSVLDRKKLSFGAAFTYKSASLLMKLTGAKMPTKLIYRCVANTTLSCSNVVGPLEEIQMFGHQITHILPTVSGQPQALCVHFQSYMDRVAIILSAASDVVPDPEKLCKYITEALEDIKVKIAMD